MFAEADPETVAAALSLISAHHERMTAEIQAAESRAATARADAEAIYRSVLLVGNQKETPTKSEIRRALNTAPSDKPVWHWATETRAAQWVGKNASTIGALLSDPSGWRRGVTYNKDGTVVCGSAYGRVTLEPGDWVIRDHKNRVIVTKPTGQTLPDPSQWVHAAQDVNHPPDPEETTPHLEALQGTAAICRTCGKVLVPATAPPPDQKIS